MVGDAGCERIHKEEKVQKEAKFLFFNFYFPKKGKGLGVEKCTSTRTGPEGSGLRVSVGQWGGCSAGRCSWAAACFRVVLGAGSSGRWGLVCPVS